MSNIKFVKGNAVDALLSGDIDFLLNQVNAQNKYASGIAKEIGERIPRAKERYHGMCEEYLKVGRKVPLGMTATADGIIHIVGQEFYGRGGKRYTNYGALASGIEDVFNIIYCSGYTKNPRECVVGIPDMIGCGLGGADREIVLELIEHLLSWAKEVRIYTL